MVFQGLGAAVIFGIENVLFRFMLAKKRMTAKSFTTLTFIGLFILLLPLLPFFFSLNPKMFSTIYLLLLAGVVILAIGRNLLYFKGLKHSKVEKVEPLALSSWVFTILLAFIIFPEERDLLNVALALIASLAILSINIKKHHFKLDKYAIFIIISAFLWAIHAVLLKQLLVVYNPLMLVFVRAFFVSIILLVIYGVRKKDFTNNKWKWLILISVIGIISWGLMLWSYQELGIILTSLLLTLSPLVAEWTAKIFLKEKLHWKNLVTTIIIILCIIISLLNSFG